MSERPTGEAARGVAASAHDLVKTYGKGEAEVRALDGVTVDLMQGEFTAVMGPSGSGKSTLMHCLAALDTPTSGEAVVDGTYEIFRYHFALPSHITAEGHEVAATRGVVGSMLMLLEDGATHVGIAVFASEQGPPAAVQNESLCVASFLTSSAVVPVPSSRFQYATRPCSVPFSFTFMSRLMSASLR